MNYNRRIRKSEERTDNDDRDQNVNSIPSTSLRISGGGG